MKSHGEEAYCSEIRASLANCGWKAHAKSSCEYDATVGFLSKDLLYFVQSTQPSTYLALSEKGKRPEKLLSAVRAAINKAGASSALKRGLVIEGHHVALCGFEHQAADSGIKTPHSRNLFSFVPELIFSTDKKLRLDLVLFLNGIPLFTFEFKSEMSRQTCADAMLQYRKDRKPEYGIILSPGSGALAHFAVSQAYVWYTTCLAGDATVFFPFNTADGAGYDTSHLWSDFFQTDSVLSLLEYFVFQRDNGGIIFPRHHQWDCVKKLKEAVMQTGVGERYLMQHSAGSGKSNTIAWLASSLAELHEQTNKKVFDQILVLTDRLVLDQQLSDVLHFMHEGQESDYLTRCTSTKDLANALVGNCPIVISTLQKFGVLGEANSKYILSVKEKAHIKSKRFAVIIDEAHSSQGRECYRRMLNVLTKYKAHGRKTQNLSFFAFTATPLQETLELFGSKDLTGQLRAYHQYSMTQAINEGYILDVLKGYSSVNTLVHVESMQKGTLVKNTQDVKRAIDTSPEVILARAEEIVRVMNRGVVHSLSGNGQAMVVCSSREAAIKFKLTLDKILSKERLAYKALCAFTEKVEVDGHTYDEFSINEMAPGTDLSKLFYENPLTYKLLVVADKFQVGFNCPNLVGLFVIKSLKGAAAVQTLSRVNRCTPGKKSVIIRDFINSPNKIQEAFQKYAGVYTVPPRGDVGCLVELSQSLDSFGIGIAADMVNYKLAKKAGSTALWAMFAEVKKNRFDTQTPERQEEILELMHEFYDLAQLCLKITDEANQYALKAEFVSRFITIVDKQHIIRASSVPLKVILAEIQESEGVGLSYSPQVNDEEATNKNSEYLSSEDELLENFLQKISAKSFPGASHCISNLVLSLQNHSQVKKEACSYNFEKFIDKGVARVVLTRLVHAQKAKNYNVWEFLNRNFIELATDYLHLKPATKNILEVVYTRCRTI